MHVPNALKVVVNAVVCLLTGLRECIMQVYQMRPQRHRSQEQLLCESQNKNLERYIYLGKSGDSSACFA